MSQFLSKIIVIVYSILVLFSACRNSASVPYDKGLVCLPYSVSREKTIVTNSLEPFGRIVSEVEAEIVYHVLPDKSMSPYITLEGHKDIVDRMEWVVKYNGIFNQHELQIKYSKCMIKSRNRSTVIHIYGHELFQVRASQGSFVSTDTILSNIDQLYLIDAGDVYFDVVCKVPILLIDLTSVSYFVLHGVVDSCIFQIQPDGGKSPINPSNLRNLDYRSLNFREKSNPYWNDIPNIVNIFAGRPKRITYSVDRPYVKLFYQGNPEIIAIGSTYDPLIWEP